jgi:hypothetical protein
MKTEINSLCEQIATAPSPGGIQTASQQQDELVKMLNTCVNAESLCYFCIETLPEQSEIKITAENVSRIIDISYTANQKLEFVNMHD